MKLFRKVFGAVLLSALVCCCGCGGNSGFSSNNSTLVFTAASTGTLTTPISGIDLVVTLPEGISVATSGSASEQIASDAVVPNASLGGTTLASGSYASSRKTHLAVIMTSNSYKGGEFLRLRCDIASGSSVTREKTAASPVTIVKAVGFDPETRTTVTLTDKVKVTMALK
jgi:hypothetical protein